MSQVFSPIPEILEELQSGRMIVLVDDEHRENEGDLVCAAEKVTPEIINFMALHGRGLICLPMAPEFVDRLHLAPQTPTNTAAFGTAFTVSVDARTGITTGISAADRARTVLLAIADSTKPEDLARPGHVFPIRAREGGVLVRAGQTEGAVDLARLAGLKPAGVICEIMKPDGSMARLPDLLGFCREHGLKICTVAQIIEFRHRNERLVERVVQAKLATRHADFDLHVYESIVDPFPHIALTLGGIGLALGLFGPLLVMAALFRERTVFDPSAAPEFFRALLAGGLLALALGLADDVRRLPPLGKLVAQIVCALAAVAFGARLARIILPNDAVIAFGPFGAALTVAWIVFFMNAFNFMDGIDGQTARFGAIASIGLAFPMTLGIDATQGWAVRAGCLMLLAGALLGFLRFNTAQPSRVFMGDGGSQMVGYILALSLATAHPAQILAGLLVLWPFVYDVLYTLARRAVRRENLLQAHREHLYQRLLKTGLTHRETARRGGAFQLVCLAASVYCAVQAPRVKGAPFQLLSVGVVALATILYTAHVLWRERAACAPAPPPTRPRGAFRGRGFSIYEVLAAVCLLFVIGSTAVPKLRSALTRAGAARAARDLKTLAGALDLYRLDYGAYPPSVQSPEKTVIPLSVYGGPDKAPPLVSHRQALIPLTTPMAYLARVDFNAPFPAKAWEIAEAERRSEAYSYWYSNYNDFFKTGRGRDTPLPLDGYLLLAFGPMSSGVGGLSAPYADIAPSLYTIPLFNRPNIRNVYDPTNGAISAGNIMVFGGQLGIEPGMPYMPTWE
ncbi:MAG: 3,4-dihydroxy-2-butanone-4-phosphate synthase [Candidatus Sumerlaeota bacterium]|nr:3,4-dihydroxy-2-butanone-4-phosphate synthase [Candidatus Sumerlaeota bacterium]